MNLNRLTGDDDSVIDIFFQTNKKASHNTHSNTHTYLTIKDNLNFCVYL